MVLLLTPAKVQQKLAKNLAMRRLQMELTQAGLAKRSGVSLATLRKFEQKGVISLQSFLKLQMVLGGLQEILQATEIQNREFSSIDEVIAANNKVMRKRGKSK